MSTAALIIPLRIYQTSDRIMVAAPMAGLEPGNICVTVAGDRLTIHGDERGPHQHELDLVLAEWAVGPYHREVVLPEPVNGALANATYGNGVLVLSLPKMEPGREPVSAEIRLEVVDATRGERVGHVGREIRPTTTEEHLKRHVTDTRPPPALEPSP
jgi:HSP20 family protein